MKPKKPSSESKEPQASLKNKAPVAHMNRPKTKKLPQDGLSVLQRGMAGRRK